MPTAIVTITCPSCGGRVEGISATDNDQTVKCTFCGTDLHIPRIGAVVHERVVREVIREVDSAPSYAVDLAPKRNPLIGLIALGCAVPLLAVMVCVSGHEGDDEIAKIEREEAARNECTASCKAQCAHAGDQETGKWNVGYEFGGSDDGLEKQMKDTDVLICQSQCEVKSCIGLGIVRPSD